MAIFDDVVRPYQLPNNSPTQLYLSQYNRASRTPVIITPGQSSNGLQQVPLQTGRKTYRCEVQRYLDMAAIEQAQSGD